MPKITRDAVVRRIKAVQAELGLQTGEMAKVLGIGRTTYLNWIASDPKKPNFPSEEGMAALCEALPKLTLDYLYLGKLDTMPTALAIRLTARELGLNPDAQDFPAEMVGAAVAQRAA